jgi:MATE family multidrug resistance protein
MPILIGQLAQIGMGVTDTIMAGRYSAEDLAAIAIGQSIWLPVLMFFIGLSTACTTQVARHAGARDTVGVKHSVQQMLWLLWLLSPLGILLVMQADIAFTAMGIDPSVSNITDQYLGYLSFGIPAIISYLALRGFSEGMRATRPIMLVNVAALLINIPLNYAFIYGQWGAPEMGAAGCGVATAIVMWVQLVGVIVVVKKLPQLKVMTIFSHWQAPRWSIISSQINLGLPIALSTMAEVALFAGVALILAQLGADVVAGHQIALSIASMMFMVPLSFGIAITIHSGQYLGAGKEALARYSSTMGVIGGALIAILTMSIILIGRHTITAIYTDDPVIQEIALSLLVFAAVFQLPDAIQVCAASALRAYLDTRVPMVFMLFSYWVVSIPLGWSLTHGFAGFSAMGAEGMWTGLVCGLTCAAILQSWRLWWVLNNRQRPSAPSLTPADI